MIRSVLQTPTQLENVSLYSTYISRTEALTILHIEPGTSVRVETRVRAGRPENRSSIPDGVNVYSIHSVQPGFLLSEGYRRFFTQGVKGSEKLRGFMSSGMERRKENEDRD
jgi:hypothetical protein